jgi:hypothetical protein
VIACICEILESKTEFRTLVEHGEPAPSLGVGGRKARVERWVMSVFLSGIIFSMLLNTRSITLSLPSLFVTEGFTADIDLLQQRYQSPMKKLEVAR